MTQTAKGPIAAEIEKRLTEALAPERLEVMDDSEKHRGHAGHDARGESHFSVEVVSSQFAGLNRVARQRLVNGALAELLRDRVHALTMVTKVPGELAPPRRRAPAKVLLSREPIGEGDHAKHGGGAAGASPPSATAAPPSALRAATSPFRGGAE